MDSYTLGDDALPDSPASDELEATADDGVDEALEAEVADCATSCPKDFCGLDDCGQYCPCGNGLYCDDTTSSCVAPVASCSDGWCRIPAGSFLMGATAHHPSYDRMLPQHAVVLSRSFEMMDSEVTRAMWKEVWDTSVDPSGFPACGDQCPVAGLSVFAMMEFANAVSTRAGLETCYELVGCAASEGPETLDCSEIHYLGPDCAGYRLPTEAEWEFAARAGSTTCYPNGEHSSKPPNCSSQEPVASIGWFCGNSAVSYEGCGDCSGIEDSNVFPPSMAPECCGVHPVAELLPNAFGLYDVAGNVREVTGTVFRDHDPSPKTDPGHDALILWGGTGEIPDGDVVVFKGGGFASVSFVTCSAWRSRVGLSWMYTSGTGAQTGFRLVRSLPD